VGQLILFSEWARGPNGFNPSVMPCPAVLNRMAKTKQTFPAAIKMGRRWVVDEEAKFIGIPMGVTIPENIPESAKELIRRATNGGQTKETQYQHS